MSNDQTQLYAQEYFDYLNNRSTFRRWIRKSYLKDISKYCKGKTIDFGCGVGELLSLLPNDSIGFEINKVITDYSQAKGVNIQLYDPEKDQYKFEMVPANKYSSFTMNHVLEHLEDSNQVIEQIFESCSRLGIERIVFTVPGHKGYLSDQTHRTFIDVAYFQAHGLLENKHYQLFHTKYFPINWETFSRYFTHNELRIIFNKRNG